jgi:hypothetical protein
MFGNSSAIGAVLLCLFVNGCRQNQAPYAVRRSGGALASVQVRMSNEPPITISFTGSGRQRTIRFTQNGKEIHRSEFSPQKSSTQPSDLMTSSAQWSISNGVFSETRAWSFKGSNIYEERMSGVNGTVIVDHILFGNVVIHTSTNVDVIGQ